MGTSAPERLEAMMSRWIASHALLDGDGEEIELAMLYRGLFYRTDEWAEGGRPPTREALAQIGWRAVELPLERKFSTLHTLPDQTQGPLGHYVAQGRMPGGFLRFVVCNNLVEAVLAADPVNLDCLPRICSFLRNETPVECWGSKAKVDEWHVTGGLAGRLLQRQGARA